MTLVLGYCGLRLGEAAALRRKDIGDQHITVRSSATYVAGRGILETGTKTNRSRLVPVPEPIWELVKEHLPAERDALVFPSRKGEHLSNHEYRRAFELPEYLPEPKCGPRNDLDGLWAHLEGRRRGHVIRTGAKVLPSMPPRRPGRA